MARILISDDNSIITKMLQTTFRLEGHDAIISHNGYDSLEKAHEFKPDFIITDVMKPGLDGFELVQRLKTSEDTKDIPVIFLTNLYQSQHQELARQLGAVDFLVKAHMSPPLSWWNK